MQPMTEFDLVYIAALIGAGATFRLFQHFVGYFVGLIMIAARSV